MQIPFVSRVLSREPRDTDIAAVIGYVVGVLFTSLAWWALETLLGSAS